MLIKVSRSQGFVCYLVSKRYAVIVARAIMLKWTCVERILCASVDYGQNEHSAISFALH